MARLVRVLWAISWRTALFCAVVGAGLWWMNRPKHWDATANIAKPGEVATGRIGVVVAALAMPERYDPVFFENFLDKLFTGVIPWPINVLAGSDAGVALMDPGKPYATAAFTPTQLADIWGRTSDIDGTPWIEKYRRGEIRWEKPSATVPEDVGFFLYPDRKGGTRTATAKVLLKSRYLYYAALPDGYMPHHSQTMGMAEAALVQLRQRPGVVAASLADAFNPYALSQSVNQVLDAGVDTLVLGSVQPIHSDFEEMKGSFQKIHKAVEAWRARNGNKPVRILIAPQIASQQAFLDLWLAHLDRVTPKAKPGQAITVLLSKHGLPVSLMASDSWVQRFPAVVAAFDAPIKTLMAAKGYAKTTIIDTAEGFADGKEDPDQKILSTAEGIAQARAAGVDVVVALPIEFLAENTDTLFAHAAIMFKGLPGYTPYQGPPAGIDWQQPYVRSFQTGKTRIIYAGSPGGAAQPLASKALVDTLGTVIPIR
jgi:hypothetical protein